MRKHVFLLFLLSGYVLSAFAQTQTKTGAKFNNIGESYLNLWAQAVPSHFSTDDNSFAYTKKLTSARGGALLILQDFKFNIPSDATIDNISVKARRFKKGNGSVKDYFATLLRINEFGNTRSQYGVWFQDPNNYTAIESDVIYSQVGTGNNGGHTGDQPYAWTPAMLNDPAFGVRIENYAPVGGSAVLYYDLVEITVAYTAAVTPTASRKRSVSSETKPISEPKAFPNPFTSKTSIQFTATTTGIASVELFDISGNKIRTLFSGSVIQGQVYQVAAGDAQLAKGIYVYMINNGKQSQRGRIIKVD